MNRQEEIKNYANSFKGKGMENEELKEIIKLAIIDGAVWADNNPKWKPSKEQIATIEYIIKEYESTNINLYKGAIEQLFKLLEQLKAL